MLFKNNIYKIKSFSLRILQFQEKYSIEILFSKEGCVYIFVMIGMWVEFWVRGKV